jgi:hypothetical protein
MEPLASVVHSFDQPSLPPRLLPSGATADLSEHRRFQPKNLLFSPGNCGSMAKNPDFSPGGGGSMPIRLTKTPNYVVASHFVQSNHPDAGIMHMT